MKKILRWLFPLILLFGVFAGMTAAKAAENVGYLMKGTVDERAGTFDLEVYGQHARLLGGRLALGFDSEKLELEEPSDFNAVFHAGNGIRLHTEGLAADALMSNDGFVGFCWNPSYTALDAVNNDRMVARIRFHLKPGVTAASFDDDTVRLMRLKENENWRWETTAWLRESGLIDYMYAVPGVYPCAVTFDYPNCGVQSPKAREITFQLRNGAGKSLSGTIHFNGAALTVDASGDVQTTAPRGAYLCMATVPGYESKTLEVEITDHQTVTIVLRTDEDVVNAALGQVQIGYAEGDSAEAVRKDLILPVTGEGGCSIQWKSSRPVVVSDYGNVYPLSSDAQVTLTAAVKYGTAQAERTFTITVLGTGSSSSEAPVGKFRDLGAYPWAREAIEALTKAGVISGTSETTFSPGANVTRGDFMALLMRMLEPEGSTEAGGFLDVPQDSYYYMEIALAKALGIASGTGDGRFLPQSNVSRQDMVVLTYRALLRTGALDEQSPRAALESFKDAKQISDYAQTALAVMVQSGAISGNTDGTLNPQGNATRAEAAVFLYHIYKQ